MFYGQRFRIAFLENKGSSFETLFSRIMAHAHPNDFELVAPYGKLGDLKCDGYRASDKTVFQCYGPSTPTLEKLLAKMAQSQQSCHEPPHGGLRGSTRRDLRQAAAELLTTVRNHGSIEAILA